MWVTSSALHDDNIFHILNSKPWDKLKDGLQLACIRKADLRKQAKGLRKVHLRDCLINAQTKRQHKWVAAIKQRCN